MSRIPHLRGETPESLAEAFPDLALSPRLARRVVDRLVRQDGSHLDDVEGLARAKAAALMTRGRVDRLEVIDRRVSERDGFAKYLLRAPDGAAFEAVRIPLEQPRWSACVSSQAGCGMACAFCETGRLGLARSLEPWEIVEQVLTIRREAPERPLTGVVFQGQGEPFHAYASVIRAAQVLQHPCGGRIGSDRITISTVGLVPEIERFTDEGHRYRLILSLTSAFPEKRASLVPVGKAHDVADLARAMSRHAWARNAGVVNLAWVLMGGVNDEPAEAREVARLFRGCRVRLSVIDVNDPTGRFRRASDAERRAFFAELAAQGIAIHRRYSGGPDIAAACGMLAGRSAGGLALPPPGSPA